MVDIIEKRFTEAPSPSQFSTIGAWLEAATTLSGIEKSGLQASLAKYVARDLKAEPSPQLIGSWIRRGEKPGSLPSIQCLRIIADWARISFLELKQLYDRDLEARQLEPRSRTGGRTAKKATAPLVKTKKKSPIPARSGSLKIKRGVN